MDKQQIINLVISVSILAVLALFTSGFARTATAWRRNRRSPRLGAEVTVIAKQKSEHRHSRGPADCSVVFRLKNDEPISFSVPEDVYDELHEDDRVKIIFKGTQFLSFQRLTGQETSEESDHA